MAQPYPLWQYSRFAAGAAAGGAGAAAGGMGAMLGIAQMGIGIMGAMAQHQSQMAQYNEQVRFRMEQAKQAQETLNQQVAQQQTAYTSEIGKLQGQAAEVAIEAREAESRAAAAAAESGVVGLSVGNLLAGIEGKKGRYLNRLSYNANMGYANTQNQLKMAERGAVSTVASIPIPTKPSFLPTAVSIGSAVVGGLGKMNEAGAFRSASSLNNPLNAHHVMPV